MITPTYSTGFWTPALLALSLTAANAAGPAEIGHPKIVRCPDDSIQASGAYVSLGRLMSRLSSEAKLPWEATDALRNKRLHIYSENLSPEDLQTGLQVLCRGRWRSVNGRLVLSEAEGASSKERKLREKNPEPGGDEWLGPEARLSLAGALLEASRSDEGLQRMALLNPKLGSAMKDPMTRAIFASLRGLQPYELLMMSGGGLEVPGAGLASADVIRVFQGSGAYDQGVTRIQSLGVHLNEERLLTLAHFQGVNGGGIVQSRAHPLKPAVRPAEGGAPEIETQPSQNTRAEEIMVDPRAILGPDPTGRRTLDWPATLERLARVHGLKILSDAHYRPMRLREKLNQSLEPFKTFRVKPGERVPLGKFLSSLAAAGGFTLTRSGDVYCFIHRLWYWESRYRVGDTDVDELIRVGSMTRRRLAYQTGMLKHSPAVIEALSELFPELMWLRSAREGVRLYATLSDQQQKVFRGGGLSYTSLNPSQRALFWIWQQVPKHLAPPLQEPVPLIIRPGPAEPGEQMIVSKASEPGS